MSTSQDNIERLRREIEVEIRKQKNCSHQWSEAKYDPEEKTEFLPDISKGLQGHGSDPYYETYASKKTVPRWSRSCGKCGKVQYTYREEIVTTIKKPNFG